MFHYLRQGWDAAHGTAAGPMQPVVHDLSEVAEEDVRASLERMAPLVDEQNADGSWSESEFTGTGFPCVFYLKYHLYRNSFPVYALARYANQSRGADEYVALKFQPSEFPLRRGF